MGSTGATSQTGEVVRLADGSRVESEVVEKVVKGLQIALGPDCDREVFFNLLNLADGGVVNIPAGPSEHILMQTYVDSGLCRPSVDGTVSMHRLTASVVRNALKVDTAIDPGEQRNFGLVDPTVLFTGFKGQPSET